MMDRPALLMRLTTYLRGDGAQASPFSPASRQQTSHWQAKAILTLEEAASYLRIKPETLLKEVRQGNLPGCQLGGEWRFSLATLEVAFSNDLSGPTIPPPPLYPETPLDRIPDRTWEYFSAWVECIEIRKLITELQEKMCTGVMLHELVSASTFDRLGEKMHQLWQHTVFKEEEVHLQHFGDLYDWVEQAKQHYSDYKMSCCVRETRTGPEYKLHFQHLYDGELVLESAVLPVQTQWTPVEQFQQDPRRYDYTIHELEHRID